MEQFSIYLRQLRDNGYFDDRGNLLPSLCVEDAEMVGRVLAASNITSGQLRRFYTMARGLEQRFIANGDFATIVPGIASMQPMAALLVGRESDQEKRTKLSVLRNFIDINAELARQDEHAFLKGFLPHFESVLGYYTFYRRR